MKKLTCVSIILLMFLNCQNKKGSGNDVLESENRSDQLKDSLEKSQNNIKQAYDYCFESYFKDFISKNEFDVKNNERNSISRIGTQACFLKKNETYFSRLEKELFFEISDNKKFEKPILVKKLIFSDKKTANYIFNQYKKGYNDGCLPIKEPSFFIKDSEHIYMFFVSAEYLRESLNVFKEEILEDIESCEKIQFFEYE